MKIKPKHNKCCEELDVHLLWYNLEEFKKNLLVDIMNLWTALVKVILVEIISGFSISIPSNKSSNIMPFLFILWKCGIECSTRSNKIQRSGKYKNSLEERPTENNCWFKLYLQILTFVKSREQTKVGFRVPKRNQEVLNSPKRVPERNQKVGIWRNGNRNRNQERYQ